MKKDYVPDWKLERYLLGELPAADLEAIAALEQNDDGLRARLDALRASNDEILAKYPPAWMARRSARVVEPRHSWDWKIFSRWAIPAFVCAAALICLPTHVFSPAAITGTAYNASKGQERFADVGDGIRIKGLTPSIEVWRKTGENAEKLSPDATARAGDIVQLRYVVPKFCYGALISIDGRGVLTVHLSGDDGKAAPLTPGRPIALNNSYQLDDAPDFETFYLITSAHIFDVNSAVEALKIAGYPLDTNGEVKLAGKRQITGFTLLKSYDSASAGRF